MFEHRNEFTSSVPIIKTKNHHLLWTADKNIPYLKQTGSEGCDTHPSSFIPRL